MFNPFGNVSCIRTYKAVEKSNGLWCHMCYTMDINKEYCMNVTRNDSSLHYKCHGDMRMCMVKRVSYSASTSNSSGSVHKVWSLERNCTQKCEPGCIIIGINQTTTTI
ncbi:conserved hypothetical protein [Pediculus humanus corporis]|uniref:Uncharacterized protein n=1 Tax=Pediculus humanus subsp. corporis TaxID=121224 RepID=E0VI63_PEDHC|nr:uncharacterized protein Phum_PHUM221230 [Pediculus humanus corporis]EEB13069.1 conserved hypothetical protein [Pediculus humanus corporis]